MILRSILIAVFALTFVLGALKTCADHTDKEILETVVLIAFSAAMIVFLYRN